MAQVRRFMDRWGGWAIFIGRFVGLVRPLAPFAAGAVRMPYRPFLAYNVAGALAWAGVTVALGYFTGTAAEPLLRSFGVVMVGAGAVVILAVVALRRGRRGATTGAVTPTEPAGGTSERAGVAQTRPPRIRPPSGSGTGGP